MTDGTDGVDQAGRRGGAAGWAHTERQDDCGQPVDLVASCLSRLELRAVPRRITVKGSSCALLASALGPDLIPQPAQRGGNNVVRSGLEHMLPLRGGDVEARQLRVSKRLHKFLERGQLIVLEGLRDGGVYLAPCLTEDLGRGRRGAALPCSVACWLGLRRLPGLRLLGLGIGLRCIISVGVFARELWVVPRTRHTRAHTAREVLRRDRLNRVRVAD